jgi:hypothetical protein
VVYDLWPRHTLCYPGVVPDLSDHTLVMESLDDVLIANFPDEDVVERSKANELRNQA